MPDAVIHPTPQELTAFGLGKLPERAAAVVAAHLESCTACRKAVASVSADSFLNKVREAKQDRTVLPSSLAKPPTAPGSAGGPAIPVVPCPNMPPELARHSKYLILRELGRGGMGVVYQARQTVMNRQVVIKVINRSLLDRPESLERFHREIRAAAQLSHRNIVTAYDAEQAGEMHMLVMEFVPGQTLAEVVEKKGPLPVTNACYYASQAALGLQHAHERGMVHRDIKPQNLMLTPKDLVKILDFGLAKVASERGASKGLTSSDACMGTPEYIAPEQAEDSRSADIRADLYSLGCTLYFLLAGRPPFREETWVKTVLAHIQKTPQPLPELRPDVPAELWQVIARLLSKEPAQRYEKPVEVARALAPFIKSRINPYAKEIGAPASGVRSPTGGTKIGADTNQVKKILQKVPAKTASKELPAKKEDSPFSDLTDAAAAPKPSRAAWWRRPGVLAAAIGVPLALILMAVIIIINVKTPGGTIVLEDLPDNAVVTVDDKFVKLFNGKDLTGWKKHLKQPGNWHVVNGTDGNILTCSGALAGYLYSEGDDYQDFHLVVRARINDEGTGGVYIRTPLDPQFPQVKPYPDGYEALINSTRRDMNKTGALYISEAGYAPRDHEVPVPHDHWFQLEVIAEGNHIIVKVDGVTTTDYTDEKRRFTSGHIALEQFGAGTKVEFRTIKIKKLTKEPEKVEKGDEAHSPPSEEKWIREVRGLPAEQQWQAVANKLMERNPSFDGELKPTIEDGRVTGLEFVADHVTDISPVRAVTELRSLSCKGSGPDKGKLADLSPLKGMKLSSLNCRDTRVSDLSPLKDMPLKIIGCDFRPERDTEILRSIKTLEKINGRPVVELLKPASDLMPLFTEKQLAEWRFVPDQSDAAEGKDIGLRDGIIVLDEPGSLLVTKRADYRYPVFTVEVAASEGAEAYTAVHFGQQGKNWLGKTSWIFDDGSKIRAGMQSRNFKNPEIALNGIDRAQLDYEQFFTIRMSIRDNDDIKRVRSRVMKVFVNGRLRSGVSYNGDPIHRHEGRVGIKLIKGCLRIRKLDVQVLR